MNAEINSNFLFYTCGKSISRTNPVLPIKNFRLLYDPGMRCYSTLFNFRLGFCQVVDYGRLKTKENFRLLALKVVSVAYKRLLLTRGSKRSDLT